MLFVFSRLAGTGQTTLTDNVPYLSALQSSSNVRTGKSWRRSLSQTGAPAARVAVTKSSASHATRSLEAHNLTAAQAALSAHGDQGVVDITIRYILIK